MSLSKNKQFCFSCKDWKCELVKTCKDCKLAKYCSVKCQDSHFVDHMQLCAPAKLLREKAINEGEILKARGFNIYETHGHDWYQWAKLYGEHEELVEQFVQNKTKSCMNLVKISQDSYQGLKVVLDEILELMKISQPHFLYLRYKTAILMLMLGKDGEAYNFIKFWLSKSRVEKDKDIHAKFTITETFEDGPFLKDFTKNGQDKRENVFEKLPAQVTKNPFFADWIFYFCLAIIKKNTKDGQKKNSKEWKKQGEHFKVYKLYLKEHFPEFVHVATTFEIQALPDEFIVDESNTVMCDYLPILVAYLNKAPAVKEALIVTLEDKKVCESDLIQSMSLRSSNDGDTFLHTAAARKDSAVVLLAMKSKFVMDKNPRNNEGITPLHFAASRGHFQICGMFIDQIEDKNPKDNHRYTPLHFAAYVGNLEICKLICNNVQDKNPSANDGETPLHLAAQNGHLAVARFLIENIVSDKNPEDKIGMTPLHYAARKGRVAICQLILKQVEEKHPENKFGQTPLDLADGHKNILRVFRQFS